MQLFSSFIPLYTFYSKEGILFTKNNFLASLKQLRTVAVLLLMLYKIINAPFIITNYIYYSLCL